jgi:hypothetical protein
MANYFSYLPDFEYVSRLPGATISDYKKVKNIFKRGVLREDIFQNLSFFTKYQVKGDDRPDNVANEVYDDPDLDWLVLISNNIINFQSEWPLTQLEFDAFLLEKYGTYAKINEAHHYETVEIKNNSGAIIVNEGLQVESDFSISFYDTKIGQQVTVNNSAVPVTNYEYEEGLEDKKRDIFLLKPEYVNVVIDDLEEMMLYKKGSTQYVSETLKRADNVRLYQ